MSKERISIRGETKIKTKKEETTSNVLLKNKYAGEAFLGTEICEWVFSD